MATREFIDCQQICLVAYRAAQNAVSSALLVLGRFRLQQVRLQISALQRQQPVALRVGEGLAGCQPALSPGLVDFLEWDLRLVRQHLDVKAETARDFLMSDELVRQQDRKWPTLRKVEQHQAVALGGANRDFLAFAH